MFNIIEFLCKATSKFSNKASNKSLKDELKELKQEGKVITLKYIFTAAQRVSLTTLCKKFSIKLRVNSKGDLVITEKQISRLVELKQKDQIRGKKSRDIVSFLEVSTGFIVLARVLSIKQRANFTDLCNRKGIDLAVSPITHELVIGLKQLDKLNDLRKANKIKGEKLLRIIKRLNNSVDKASGF